MPRSSFIKLGEGVLTHDAEEGFILEGEYRGERYRIHRRPLQSNSLHIEYDYCYVKPEDCVDISVENDNFFCYPKHRTDVVTKLAFATEIIYERHMENKRREMACRKSKEADLGGVREA